MNDQVSKEFDYHKNDEGTMIDTITAYVHEVKQHAAVAPCDDTLKMFTIQDFSCATCSLKVSIV